MQRAESDFTSRFRCGVRPLGWRTSSPITQCIHLDETIGLTWGLLRLEIINTTDGSGILREFVVALANMMLGYTNKGICVMFDARVSSTRTHRALKV